MAPHSKRLFRILLLALVLTSVSAAGMEMQNFVCLKCRMFLLQDSRPSPNYCRAGGNHNWFSLGKAGPLIHICLKCRIRVDTAARPSPNYCRAGGNHNWQLLGNKGLDNYSCRKCGLKLRTSGRPSPNYCPAGGNHNWFKY